jgi:aquaporin Z
MDKKLLRDYLIELVGSFLLVLTAAAVTCVNHLTLPSGQTAGVAPLTLHQPGLVGMAVAQGLTWAVLLALTAPVTGGYLNPALTLMLWLFNRLSTARAAWLIGAQMIGGVLAGLCIRFAFQDQVLQLAHYGAPHVNPLTYPSVPQGSIWAGLGIEFVLTFFLAFAIFGGKDGTAAGPHGAWLAGAVVAASVLVAYPLTGAALNPARWFGPVLWEFRYTSSREPFRDAIVFVAGPMLGAIVGGWWCFKVYRPERAP